MRRNSECGDNNADDFLFHGCLCYVNQKWYDVVSPVCGKEIALKMNIWTDRNRTENELTC